MDGDAPSGIDPRTSSVGLPGRRRVRIDAALPGAPVATALTTVSPLPAGATLIAAESPAAGPGAIVTRTASSLNWSAPTPAA